MSSTGGLERRVGKHLKVGGNSKVRELRVHEFDGSIVHDYGSIVHEYWLDSP